MLTLHLGTIPMRWGNVLLVNSNPVALEVQKMYSLTLVQNQNQYGVVGGAVNLPHVLTNIGNTADGSALGLEYKVALIILI